MADSVRDGPAWRSAEWQEIADLRRRCRATYYGTTYVQKAADEFLPRHPLERPQDYARRLKVGELYNAFARSIRACVGLVFQRAPILSGNAPEEFVQHWENINGEGQHGKLFARQFFTWGMVDGLGGILVDFPPRPEVEGRIFNLEDFQKAQLRPIWVPYSADQIISADYRMEGGQRVMEQLVLEESVWEKVGQYQKEKVEQWRVLRNVGGVIYWTIYRQSKKRQADGSDYAVYKSGTLEGVNTIPFAPCYVGDKMGDLLATPPFIDAADINLGHYRVLTQRRWAMLLACNPVPVRIGYTAPPGQLTAPEQQAGPTVVMDLPLEGDFKWVAAPHSIMSSTADELKTMEFRMAALTMSFLSPPKREADTATGRSIDTAASNATILTAAQSLNDCLNEAAGFHVQYLGKTLDKDQPIISVNTNLNANQLPPEVARLLIALVETGRLSTETMWQLLENGGLLPDGFNVAEELAKILKDPLSMEKMLEKQQVQRTVTDVPPSHRPKEGPKPTDQHSSTRQQDKFGAGKT